MLHFASSIATISAEDTEMTHKRKVKYPHLRRAAREMGYNFTYIWRVLEGKPGFVGRPGLVDEFWAESNRIEAEREQRKAGRA